MAQAWAGHAGRAVVDATWRHAGFIAGGALGFFCLYWAAALNWAELDHTGFWQRPPAAVAGTLAMFLGPALVFAPLLAASSAWLGRYARYRTGSVLVALLLLAAGFQVALAGTLLMSLGRASTEMTGILQEHPESRDFPVAWPGNTDPATWTAEQHSWFDPATGDLLDSKRSLWCAHRQGWLGAWRERLALGPGHNPHIDLLLWSGSLASAVGQGCLEPAAWLEQVTAAGIGAREQGGNLA